MAQKLPIVLKKGDNVSFKDVRLTGQNYKSIMAFGNSGASLKMENCSADAGTIFHGHGGNTVILKNCWSDGDVWSYRICNFVNPLKKLIVDNSGIKKILKQGKREAAIRIMQTEYAEFHGLIVQAYEYEPGKYWKQAVQDRSGGIHKWYNCDIRGQCDIGYMTTPDIPIMPLEHSYWESCKMEMWPHITKGVKKVTYKNCYIAGHLVNKTKSY